MNRKARKAHCPRADFDNMHDTRFRTYRLFANLPKLRQSPKTSEISENYARAQKKSPGEPELRWAGGHALLRAIASSASTSASESTASLCRLYTLCLYSDAMSR